MRIRSNTRLERSPSKPACLPPRAKSWQGEPPHTMSARKPSAAVISRTSGRIFEVSSLLVSIRCWRSLRHAGSLSTARTNLTACWSEYTIPPMPEKSPMPFNRRGTKFCLGRRRLSKVPAADYRVQMLAAKVFMTILLPMGWRTTANDGSFESSIFTASLNTTIGL